MSSIERYTLVDAGGSEQEFETGDYREARDRAMKDRLRVICQVYEWDDSYMVDDFTGEEEPCDSLPTGSSLTAR